MHIRQIEEGDIPALFHIRVLTDENNLSREQLSSLGITEETVRDKLNTSFKGWLCLVEDKPVGFAMGDRSTGEMWVIAVLPEYVKRGVGSQILGKVESWLFAQGCQKLWLTTDIDTNLRAYSFYRNRGWVDWKIEDGLRYMTKEGLSPA